MRKRKTDKNYFVRLHQEERTISNKKFDLYCKGTCFREREKKSFSYETFLTEEYITGFLSKKSKKANNEFKICYIVEAIDE